MPSGELPNPHLMILAAMCFFAAGLTAVETLIAFVERNEKVDD